MKKMRGGDYMEPNKELKFGGAKGMKPKRAKKGDLLDRMREGADSVRNSMNSALGRSNTKSEPVKDDKMSAKLASESSKVAITPSGAKRTNPYADAKKKDPNLGSYVKQRNAAAKGSLEYNEAQNKINKAYGKGPTNRRTTYGPEKKGENVAKVASKKASTISSGAGPKLQIRSTPAPVAKAPTKKESRQAGRADAKSSRTQDRRVKSENRKDDRNYNKGERSANRLDKKSERQGNQADRKQGRVDNRAGRKDTRAAVKGLKAQKREEIKATRKMLKGGVKPARKKAMTGLAVQGAGAGLQALGGLTNAIAGKETKFGSIADAAGGAAVTAGGMMGGVPGAQGALDAAKGAVPPPGGAPAAADPTQQPDPNAAPVARYGKKKKKGKKGMMKYKAGGAKPDYLDMDKDGNKTESMKSALKDRRSKARMGKKR